MSQLKPIYLLADSQLLFWQGSGQNFLDAITDTVSSDSLKASYVGASNGDQSEYYELFLAAMNTINVSDCRMISAFFDPEEQDFLSKSDIILLAGGDVELGWKTFKAVGLDKAILNAYAVGATLIGVSAGAMQLGMCAKKKSNGEGEEFFSTLQIVPFAISAHEENKNWDNLHRLVGSENGFPKGIGIPHGAGLIYYPDSSIQPIRYPCTELTLQPDNRKIVRAELYPSNVSIGLESSN